MRRASFVLVLTFFLLSSFALPQTQQLTYNGGPVVTNPDVVMVKYGNTARDHYDPSIDNNSVAAFVSELVRNQNSYLGLLSEYNTQGITAANGASSNQIIGLGTFQGPFAIAPANNNAPVASNGGNRVVDFSLVVREISTRASQDNLPAITRDANRNVNTIYLVYLPNDVDLQDFVRLPNGNNGNANICGGHQGTGVSQGVYSVVVVSERCVATSGGVHTPFDSLTVETSRELADAITDPHGPDTTGALPLTSWHTNPPQNQQNPPARQEVATLCAATAQEVDGSNFTFGQVGQVNLAGTAYIVQKLWSNHAQTCVVTPPAVSNDFSVNPAAGSLTVNPGHIGTMQVQVPLVSGASIPVQLSLTGAPSGVFALITPQQVNSGSSATLLLQVGASVPVGNYLLQITGKNSDGSIIHSAAVNLVVAIEDFSLSVAPTSATIQGGGSISLNVSTQLVRGNGAAITLSASSLPAGLSASFSPASVAPGQSSVMTLTGDTLLAFAPNTQMAVSGTNGDNTHTATVSLETFSGGGSGGIGPQGPVGPQGPAGPQGAQGLPGAVGPQGPKGDAGPIGLTGATGSQGPIGPTGAQGAKGDTGAAGSTGPQGPAGPQGPPGGGSIDTSNFAILDGGNNFFGDQNVFGQIIGSRDITTSVNSSQRIMGLTDLHTDGTAIIQLGDEFNRITNPFNDNITFSAFNGFIFNAADQTATQTANVFQVQQSGTPLFTIADGGNIGIGKTDPKHQLDVAGNVKAKAFIGDGSKLTGIIGTPGPQGPAGPAGATGPQGPAGPQGPPGTGTGGGSPNLKQMKAALKQYFRQNFAVGANPGPVVFDGTNIWVASSTGGTLTELRAGDGSLVGTFPVGGNAKALCFDGANIWAVVGVSVVRLNPGDGSIVATYPISSAGNAILFDGTDLWVAMSSANALARLRASDGANLGDIPSGGRGPVAMAFDGTAIWVANAGSVSGALTLIDPNDGSTFATLEFAAARGVVFDGANMWVTDASNATLSKIRVSDRTNLGSFPVFPDDGQLNRVGSAVFDGANLWVGNATSEDLIKLRTSDGSIVEVYPSDTTQFILFDGASIWVVSSEDDVITKH